MIYRSLLTVGCALILRLPGVAAGAPPATPPRETLDGIPVLTELPASPEEWAQRNANEPSLFGFVHNGDIMSAGGHVFNLGEKIPLGPAPHTPWAKPLAGGPIRLIVLGSTMNNNHDIAEIERRLDCEVFHIHSPVMHGRTPEKLPPEMDGYFADRAIETLQHEADVILVDPRARFFPARVAEAVAAKVRGGCGLVLLTGARYGGGGQFGTWPFDENVPATWKTLSLIKAAGGMEYLPTRDLADASGLFASIPWALLPAFHLPDSVPVAGATVAAQDNHRPLAITGELEKGRIVVLPYGTYFGAFPMDEMGGKTGAPAITEYHEYYAGALARTLLWAARRELPVQVGPARLEISAGKASPLRLPVTGATANAKAEMRLRDFGCHELWKATKPVTKAGVVTELPALAQGEYLLDTIVRDRAGASLGWGTCVVKVTGQGNLQISLDKPAYAPGEAARVTAKADGLPAGGNWQAALTITDARGRLLFAETKPLAESGVAWTYPNRDSLTALHEAQVVVLQDQAPYLAARADLWVPRFDVPDLANWLWPTWAPQYAAGQVFRRMRETLGVDYIMGSGDGLANRPIVASGANLFASHVAPVDPTAVERAPLQQKAAVVLAAKTGAAQLARSGAGAIYAQDERHANQDCGEATAEGLQRFREYLKSRYPDIAALNRIWGGTAFASFADVVPRLTKEFQPGPDHSLAPWMDWRLWAVGEVVGIDRAAAQAIRQTIGRPCHVGSEGLFGLNGFMMPYGGLDVPAQAEDCWDAPAPYNEDLLNLYRSFFAGPFLGWAGYGSPYADYQQYAWSCALLGRQAIGWWYGPVFYNDAYGCFRVQGKWMRDVTQPLREGIGKLLMENTPIQTEPIAFLYSQPSLYAMSILGKMTDPLNDHLFLRPAEWARESLHKLFRDCGVQFGYVSEKQLQQGQTKGIKVLVLTSCVALAPETCRAMETFVANGGIVLADLPPGAWDDHGGFHQPGQLDQLFGVKRDGNFEFKLMPSDWDVGSFDNEPDFQIAGEWFIGQYYEGTLRVADGRALGKHIFDANQAPAFVFKRTGKGATILMNYLETEYRRVPEARQRSVIKALLRMAGIRPQLAFRDIANGNAMFEENLNVLRYADGPAAYFGILGGGKRLQVELPQTGYVYELARHQYFGKTQSVAIDFREEPHALLAVLPYQIAGVRVKAERGRLGNGLPLKIELQTTGQPVKHVVHLTITKPDGGEYLGLSRNVVLRDGKWSGVLPLALNDPPGRWRITAREVVSGLTSETTAAVKK